MSSAAAARRRTAAGVRATGVSASAGSPGQPLPGGTGLAKAARSPGAGLLVQALTMGRPTRRGCWCARIPHGTGAVVGGGVMGLTSALGSRGGSRRAMCPGPAGRRHGLGGRRGLWFPYHVEPRDRVVGWGSGSW